MPPRTEPAALTECAPTSTPRDHRRPPPGPATSRLVVPDAARKDGALLWLIWHAGTWSTCTSDSVAELLIEAYDLNEPEARSGALGGATSALDVTGIRHRATPGRGIPPPLGERHF